MSDDEIKKAKERINLYMREYRKRNREKCAASSRSYRKRNPIKSRHASKKWKESNIDKVSDAAKKRNSKPETKQKRNSARRESYLKDSMVVTLTRIRNRTYSAFRHFGFKKGSKTAEILGSNWETVKAHIEARFKSGMSWENRNLWHIDHIIPISSAVSEADLHRLCHYSNLQPLWASENLSKSGKMPDSPAGPLVCF